MSGFRDEEADAARQGPPGIAHERPAPSDYRHLVSPLPLADGYSDDQVEAIHQAALTVLEELGVRVLHERRERAGWPRRAPTSDDTQVRYRPRAWSKQAIATSARRPSR